MKIHSLAIPALVATLAGCTVYQVVPAPGQSGRTTQPQRTTTSTNTAVTLGVPPGHLPPPGQCRVWVRGTPPGRQAPPRTCSQIENSAPPGSMVLYRPGRDRRVVRVRYMDDRRAGIVVRIRIFDATTLEYIRDEDVPEGPRVEPPMERNTPDDPRQTPVRRQPGEQAPPPEPARRTPPPPQQPQPQQPQPPRQQQPPPPPPPPQRPPVGEGQNRRVKPVETDSIRNEGRQGQGQGQNQGQQGQGQNQGQQGQGQNQGQQGQGQNQGQQGQGQNQGRVGQNQGQRGNQGREGDGAPGRSGEARANLTVPPGQMPRQGQCRIWIQGTPPGNQAAPRNCRGIEASAPAGAMILQRAAGEENQGLVRVQFIHAERAGNVEVIRFYRIETGEFVREEQPASRGRGNR